MIYNIFIGTILIFLSYLFYSTGTFSPSWGGVSFELGILKIPISVFLFILGLYFLINLKKIKVDDEEKISKCPNCKESFNYAELKNGKCKYCDEKDTIEIDEYYKKYPEELKDI